MAALTQVFVPDTGSQEVKLLRTQVNLLVNLVAALIDAAVAESGDGDAFTGVIELLDTSGLRVLVAKPETVTYPLPPAV